MSKTENLAESYQGRYRWTSSPDQDGDCVYATNLPSGQGVVITTGHGNNTCSAALNRVEAKELAIRILDLLTGQCPPLDGENL